MNTKDKIIKSTIDIIAKQGIDEATAGNISSIGGFTKSSIFYYFNSVDELLIKTFKTSVEKISPIFKEDFENFSNIEEYLNFYISNIINDKNKVLNLKVILSFAHQSMFFKDLSDNFRKIIIKDLYDILIKAINYYKKRELNDSDITTLSSLLMATFNGLGILLLIDGSNKKFISNWKLQTHLINSYINN